MKSMVRPLQRKLSSILMAPWRRTKDLELLRLKSSDIPKDMRNTGKVCCVSGI